VLVPPTPPAGPRKRKAQSPSQPAIQNAPDRRAPAVPPASTPRGAAPEPAASAGAPARPASVATASAVTDVAAVEGEVQNNLESLKDKLFRLELRRQAGTVTEEDYVRERARTEAILRELVRG